MKDFFKQINFVNIKNYIKNFELKKFIKSLNIEKVIIKVKNFNTEKAFKCFVIFLSAILVVSSFSTVVALTFEKEKESDILACNEIVNNIKNYELNMTSIIYSKNSANEWEEYHRIHGDENRIWVDIENIPQILIDAFLSIEDQRFYDHNGVDWKRTTSAFVNYLPFINLYSSNQGGSTVTQQLIKNITADNGETALRKIREIARAMLIEKMIDKTTILEAYLNTISLGNGICGVQVAANYYFNKNVDELTLTECASIASITKNPSAYNPISKPENNKKRRNDVLLKMFELKKITQEQYNNALKEDVVIDKSQQDSFELPINNYFVDTLIDDVINDFATKYNCDKQIASSMLYNGGYKIYATVDPNIQNIMESVYQNKDKYFTQKSRKDKSVNVQSAMTIMDYSGNIVGIVGGAGEKTVNRGLNRAVDSPRQPGSTMKPLGVYVQAIENDLANYSTIIEDKPIENYKDGQPGPKEWYGYYAGNMTVAKALERSANTIPCWLLKDSVGIDNSYVFLTQRFRFKHLNEIDKNISSLALGGCQYGITTTESAAAYAVFGNGGIYYTPTTYTKVEDKNGDIILQSYGGNRIIKETTATIMNKLLQNVVYGSEGTGGRIAGYSKMKAYAKTGTSSESKDLWMVAGTPYYVGSVWYGFDQPENVYNASAAANIWRDIMKEVHKDLETKEFVLSEDVVKRSYCTYTGRSPIDVCTSIATGYFLSGTKLGSCDGIHIEPVIIDPDAPAEPTEPDTPIEVVPPTEEVIVPPTPETPEVVPPTDNVDTTVSSTPEDITVSNESEESSEVESLPQTSAPEAETPSSDTTTSTNTPSSNSKPSSSESTPSSSSTNTSAESTE